MDIVEDGSVWFVAPSRHVGLHMFHVESLSRFDMLHPTLQSKKSCELMIIVFETMKAHFISLCVTVLQAKRDITRPTQLCSSIGRRNNKSVVWQSVWRVTVNSPPCAQRGDHPFPIVCGDEIFNLAQGTFPARMAMCHSSKSYLASL